MMTGLLTIIFGVSFETSDFIVDCLEQWWDDNKDQHSHIKQLVINLDNGPQNSSHRTQFMKRMIEFADKNNLEIVLAYYPPYHSKYNPVERCWGILENHWSATLLNTLAITLAWAKTMTWKGLSPVVKLLETTYQKGVKRGVAIFAKAFMGIPAQQAAKITRPLMPSAAPAILLQSLHTQQGVCNIVFAMTRRDFVKPAFSLRKKRSVKTHALSLLGTTRLRATS